VIKEKFYVPHRQWHLSTEFPIRSMALVVKTATDPMGVVGPIRQEIRTLDANLPVPNIQVMDDVVGATLSSPRFTGFLLVTFAGIALALSAIGVYGVLSYLVSRRTREIGIRLAIGAGRAQVLRMVLESGLVLALSGVGLGLTVALVAARFLRTMLYGVGPADPLTFVSVGVTLSLVALLSSLVPAWRATRVNPVVALKTE